MMNKGFQNANNIDVENVIRILRNEMNCVLRAEKGCSRDCEKCDLVMDSIDIINAYCDAISILQQVGQAK